MKNDAASSWLKCMTNLIVVVDPEYGELLERAADVAPCWIVDTQANKDACERMWKSHPHHDHRERGAVTCYGTANPEDRLGSLLEIVPQLETHHGVVKGDELAFPDGFVLEVIGLAPADNVTKALREVGFSFFVETPEGFQARK